MNFKYLIFEYKKKKKKTYFRHERLNNSNERKYALEKYLFIL